MHDWATTCTLAFACLGIVYIGRCALGNRCAYPLPPGPPGLPFVGNVIGMDTSAPWLTYAKWARTYGDLVHSRLLGKDIIVINSERVAKDLLEKRSGNYSDRPYLSTIDLCGLYFVSTLMHYGDQWKLHRRFFHQTFKLEAVPIFLPYQHRKACRLLQRLLEIPDKLDDHVVEYTASIILNSAYDYDPTSRQDDFIKLAVNVLSIAALVIRPDIAIVVGGFPLLLHLPSWLPGMSFKKEMEMARECSERYLGGTFEYAFQRVRGGSVAPSMVHDGLQHYEEKGIPPDESWMVQLKQASGTAFLTAVDTSRSALMTFFLMMMINPEAQKKAHLQIDAVVGNDRLPTINDRPSLPFIDAILRETLRYSPVAPLSVPHATMNDDVYNGFHIPKGTIVLTNLWSMAHDESRFPNPNAFIPERFLHDDGSLKPNDLENIVFGFGRRMCAGRHFADLSMWSVIVKVLAVFKILKPLDENGVEVRQEPKLSSGISIQPLPFKYRIVPRFPGMDAEKLDQLIATSTS